MDALKTLLKDKRLAAVLADKYQIAGFVTAIATSPEIPMPEQWMPWVLDTGAHQLDPNMADQIAEALMASLRDSLSAMRDQRSVLPVECIWSDDKASRRPLELWLTGILMGHKKVEPIWSSCWDSFKGDVDQQEVMAADLTRCLKLFSSLANVDLTLQSATPEKAKEFRQNCPLLAKQLPGVLKNYIEIAGELAGHLPNQFETFVQPQTKPS